MEWASRSLFFVNNGTIKNIRATMSSMYLTCMSSPALPNLKKSSFVISIKYCSFCGGRFIYLDCVALIVEHLLGLWSTTLYLWMPKCDPVKLADVSIKCGIFQGDISPLLFCLALNPMSMLLHPISGYQAIADRQINHMLYMDDLKLFAKSDAQLSTFCSHVFM